MGAQASANEPDLETTFGRLWDLPIEGTLVAKRFRIGQALGEGGMSVVFLARDERLGREVALKVLNPHFASSRELVTRFVNEARMLARLDCPHIVRVFDAGVMKEARDAPLPYMVLERLQGEDLRARCDLGPVEDFSQAVGWIVEACEGLAAAHAAGVIHRDLKPDNLFIAAQPDGTCVVKVLDFGIARSITAPSWLTSGGTGGVGSPGYMSPEQLRDASATDERSDIWSLGVVLYELLAGAPPFRGDNMIELSTRILACRPQRLSRRRPDLPRGLVAIVHRCLELDPSDRFADVSELAEALSHFCPAEAQGAAVRVRRRLMARQSGEISVETAPFPLVCAPSRDIDDDIALALGHAPGDARRLVARTAAALTLMGMMVLLARAFDPSFTRSTALIGEARNQVVEAGARLSLAAREAFGAPQRPAEAPP